MNIAELRQSALSLAAEAEEFGNACEENSYTDIDDAASLLESILEKLRPFSVKGTGDAAADEDVRRIVPMIEAFNKQCQKSQHFDTGAFWDIMENNAPNSIRAMLEGISGKPQ